jgi:integrase
LVTEIWCIEISDKRQDQSLKTESSRRTIPIHEDLVELGFLSFVDGLRVGKHERLFQELASGGKKYSREASKWFSRIKPKILPDADSKKCFHSFRHCFTDNLVNSNNWGADPAVKVLLGHQNKDITTGLYGAGTSIQRLKGVVDTLSWKALGVVIKRQG